MSNSKNAVAMQQIFQSVTQAMEAYSDEVIKEAQGIFESLHLENETLYSQALETMIAAESGGKVKWDKLLGFQANQIGQMTQEMNNNFENLLQVHTKYQTLLNTFNEQAQKLVKAKAKKG